LNGVCGEKGGTGDDCFKSLDEKGIPPYTTLNTSLSTSPWGRNGFDGDMEAVVAYRGSYQASLNR
jgi:hypothetical protein